MNVFDLFAKITLDDREYNDGVEKATSKGKSFANVLGNGLATAAKVGTAAIAAVGTGVTALVTSASKSFADYEQLIGGIETMFEDLSVDIEIYANDAFKTAGMSANEYMETVMGFSASLNQSLLASEGNIARSADIANQTLIDMSDNANKMGTDIEMIKNAYGGFAKGNFTMLDNLKLGYGGTKSEMERLLADAEKISGIEYDISSFADIAEAIHVMQTEMRIAGTTAKEAASTISGSFASAKAAFQNLLTGIADENADFEQLINNFVDAVAVAGNNILPRVEIALNGVGNLIDQLFPIIVQKIPEIVDSILPQITNSAVKIIESLINGISENKESLFETAIEIVEILVNGILNLLPEIIALGLDLIVSLANGIAESLPELLPTIVDVVSTIVDTLINHVDALVDAALAIIVALANGLIESLPTLIEKAPEIVQRLVDALVENIPKIVETGFLIIAELARTLLENLPQIYEAGFEIIGSIIAGAVENFGNLFEMGKEAAGKIWDAITSTDWLQLGRDIVNKVVSGIKSIGHKIWDTITSFGSSGDDPEVPTDKNSGGKKGRGGSGGGGTTVVQNISVVPQTPVEFAAATEQAFTEARWS